MKRQKWIDPSTADLIEKNPSLGIRRAEIITGLASLMHPIMGKVNPVAYSKANIFAAVTSNAYIHLGSEIADYFLEKVSIEYRVAAKHCYLILTRRFAPRASLLELSHSSTPSLER